jgi:hypothetical protein
MVPHIIEFRDDLPRTPHGKRDNAALRMAPGPVVGDAVQGPRT